MVSLLANLSAPERTRLTKVQMDISAPRITLVWGLPRDGGVNC